MGRDKAWLLLGDRPVLLHVVEAGEAAGVEVVVVGARGSSLPALPPGVARADDPAHRAFEGPLSGVMVGLDHFAERGVEFSCLAPCDAPWMTAAHVGFMLDALEEDRDHTALVPAGEPQSDGFQVLHPLCASLRVSPARALARTLLESGQRAARALLRGLGARTIAVETLPEPRVVEACNTPEQWARAVAALRV